ncbi:MAG: glutamine synthetase III [Leptonema sp. (in: Bacteria)]|nr:glutamine synthetase III [Leptonema sp. (in: bacteria)]
MKPEKKKSISEIFGSRVFNDAAMKRHLPKETYKAIRKVIDQGDSLTPEQADIIATAMKQWSLSHGATHFTHWFQPMTGFTAEKHEAFLWPAENGTAMMTFSGKELIKGEPDASSFPSGGLRATFEARGYTAWDISSPAFLKEDEGGITLCIPTAFYSYTGEALDKKTPLLLSMEALSKQAVRLLRLLGNKKVRRVVPTLGAEQEYFLIDRKYFDQRPDLIFTGRTLFGAPPPKGQEMGDHYFGAIKERIASFMSEIDDELWKLGVAARTQHNEAAPAQHELAPVFGMANLAADHNQLIMEILKKVAIRHGLVCLLHEKPFASVNGSGKHCNWSMQTNDGQNLLEPGNTPHQNTQFLLFIAALIKAVDEYGDLLRASAANPGNDHRLGLQEAPPAIVSVYLGDQLTDIFEKLDEGELLQSKAGGVLDISTAVLPPLPRDSSDRNRTAAFAFTGNKFEFRMVPSSASVSAPVFTLNTIVAEVLSQFADQLEKSDDVQKEVQLIIRETIRKHKRIIYNGNGYSEEWQKEAKRRGLPNISNSVDAGAAIVAEKNKKLYAKHEVFTEIELEARYSIHLETYSKTIHIEANTMLDMSERLIIPSVIRYTKTLSESINQIKATSVKADTSVIEERLIEITGLLRVFADGVGSVRQAVIETESMANTDTVTIAKSWRDKVFSAMQIARQSADRLEMLVDRDFWPIPTYQELLFKV